MRRVVSTTLVCVALLALPALAQITYTESNSASDLTGTQTCNAVSTQGTFAPQRLVQSAATAGSWAHSVGASTSRVMVFYSEPNDPGIGKWLSGSSYVVNLNVTVAAGFSTMTWDSTCILRVSSTGTLLASVGSRTAQAISLATTGLKSMTITASTQTSASTDRVAVVLVFKNARNATQTFTLGAADATNSIITTPINPTAAQPVLSPGAGTYGAAQSLTCTVGSGDACCYTTDGSTPAATSPGTCSTGSTYSTPFTATPTVTVKALATQFGKVNSSVLSATYTAAPAVTLTSSLTFPTTSVSSTSAAQTATLTNSGLATLNVSNVTASGDFAISGGTCSGTSFTVAASASCTKTITFTPSASGTRTGTLSFTDDATGSPHTASLTGTGLGTPRTFYIDNSATGCGGSGCSDANNGTTKTTAWVHLPMMPTCTGTCASTVPSAGDSFILRGGDTWTATDLGISWNKSGIAGTPIYIGVDATWYTGGSWTRPIFTCGGGNCASDAGGSFAQLQVYAHDVTVDNIEFTGLHMPAGASVRNGVILDGINNELKNSYFHGATHDVAATPSGVSAFVACATDNGTPTGCTIHDNVIDNSDGSQDHWYGVVRADSAYNNVIRYVSQGMQAEFNDLHGNLIENIVNDFTGDHCNEILHYGPLSGSTVTAYNNVIRNSSGCFSSGPLWLNGLSATGWPGVTVYAYNNVLYGNGSQAISVGGHPSSAGASTPNFGTFYIYNNTIEAGAAACMGNGETAPRSTTHYANNHCITSAGLIDATGTTGVNDGTNLLQTLAVANAAGYNSSQTYAYSPTSGSSPTIATGTDSTSLVSTFGAAFGRDTSYANTRLTSAHPSGSAWPIGAYALSTAVGSVSVSSITYPDQAATTTSASQTATFTNIGGALLTFTVASPTYPKLLTNTQFTVTSNTCGTTLGIGASCAVAVAFAPATGGVKTDTLRFASDATNTPSDVSLSGNGTGPPNPVCTATINGRTELSVPYNTTPTLVVTDDGATCTLNGVSNTCNTNPTLTALTADHTYVWAITTAATGSTSCSVIVHVSPTPSSLMSPF